MNVADSLLCAISEKENLLIKKLREIQGSGVYVYIYGTGKWGNFVAENLKRLNIHFEAMVSSNGFKNKAPGTYCIDDVMGKMPAGKKAVFIIAHNGYDPETLAPYADRIYDIYQYDTGCGITENEEYMTYEWVNENISELQRLYESFEDDKSRETMSAYINQRISLKFGYITSVASSDTTYFERNIIELSNSEVFVDCGAYNGDTAQSFIEELKRRGICEYDSIISFEPDIISYTEMCERKIDRHICVQKGTSDKCGTLRFLSGGTGAAISDNGTETIEIDMIDHALNGRKATFIKMDVEGSELCSLKGAANTIRKYTPTLAICVYHKREDLLTIPQFIHELVPEYRFYLRVYEIEKSAFDLVLYARLP